MNTLFFANRGKASFLLLGLLWAAPLTFAADSDAQAAAPPRPGYPYAESICNTDPNIIFCEDFEGSPTSIIVTNNPPACSQNSWSNPAIVQTDMCWSAGGTRQRPTQAVPGFPTSPSHGQNVVWRVHKTGCSTDIFTGFTAGCSGDGQLQGFLPTSSFTSDFYARMNVWFSPNFGWPNQIDLKLFAALPGTGWVNPTDAWWSADFGFWEDYFCPGQFSINNVLLFRYSGGGSTQGLQEFPFPGDSTYCPPLPAGSAPNGRQTVRMATQRWYTIEMHWVTSNNGSIARMEGWLDGVKLYDSQNPPTNQRTCAPGGPCNPMGYIFILAYMNGIDAPFYNGYVEMDNVVISRSYIGPPGGRDTTAPIPPVITGVTQP